MVKSQKDPQSIQNTLIDSYKKDFLHVVTLYPIKVKCLACMSDITYEGKASIKAHTSSNSHMKSKGQFMLQEKNNQLKLSNQHYQILNQSLEQRLEFSKKEVQNLRDKIGELQQEKTTLLSRISGINPQENNSLEENLQSLLKEIKNNLKPIQAPKNELGGNSQLLKLIQNMQRNKKKVNQIDFSKIYQQFLLHQQGLEAKEAFQAQQMAQISKATDRIEQNLNECSNKGHVLDAVQKLVSSFEIKFEAKLNEIKPKRNPDDDQSSEDDNEGVIVDGLKFAHSSKAWTQCPSMRRIRNLLTSQSDYVRGFVSPQFSEQMAHLMEVKRAIDKHSLAQHRYKMKVFAELLAENPNEPKIWVIYQFYLKFISQYKKLGPIFRVLGSHFKKLKLDKLLENIRPLIKSAIDKNTQRLGFERKAQATGKNIEDVMNDFEDNQDYEEVETDPEDKLADSEKKEFKKMIKIQLQSYFKRYRPWEVEELNKMWNQVFKHHAYSRLLFRWYLVTGSRHQDAFDITYQMFYDTLDPNPKKRKQLQIRDRKTFKPFQRVYMFPSQLFEDMRSDLNYLQEKYNQSAKNYVFGGTEIKKKHHNWFNHNIQVLWGDSQTVKFVKPQQFHRFRSTSTRIMRNNNDGTMTADRINQYFGWGADAKNCANFYDSTLPQETTQVLANFMDKFSFPKSTDDIDKCKERKFHEFIQVNLLGFKPLSKKQPGSTRSILEQKRTLKKKKKLYEHDMRGITKIQRITFEEWQQRCLNQQFTDRVDQKEKLRKQDGQVAHEHS